MAKENLDSYQKSYLPDFKFNDENVRSLSFYADLIVDVLKKEKSKSILSLGIGHSIVSQKIVAELKGCLEIYDIVEGSADIIANFTKLHAPLPTEVRVFHSYFEEFRTAVKYDAIEMGFVLEHVENPQLVVSRFKDLLIPGGCIFLAVPNALSVHRQLGHIAGFLEDPYKLSPADLQLGHKRYFDVGSFTQLVMDAGLSVSAIKGIMFKPFTTKQLQSLSLSEDIVSAMYQFAVGYPDLSNSIYIEARSHGGGL